MNGELPEGWAWAPIFDVTERVPNAKPEDTPNKRFGYVDISSIDNSSFEIADVKQFEGKDAPSRARRPIRQNDVLFSNVRTYLRNIAMVGPEAAAQLCSTGFTVLRPNAAIAPRFLFRYVLTNDFIDRVSPQQTGTHYPATSDRVVFAEKIVLPPFAEQLRIVAKLEKLLGQVDACQERLVKIPGLLKRFRHSVLAAACSGRLTEDWREASPGSEHWKQFELNEISERIQIGPFGTQLHKEDYVSNGVPLINPMHMQDSKIVPDPQFSVSRLKVKQLENYVLQENDIVMARRGEMARCVLVSQKETGWLCGTGSLFIRPKSGVSSAFLFLTLRSPEIKAFLEGESKGTTMSNLNLEILRRVPVSLPPLDEQQEIVRRVEKLFVLADQIEARFAEAKKRVDSITQSILAKAFRGELVPTEYELAKAEGRSFESAEELLERILRNRRSGEAFPKNGDSLSRSRRSKPRKQ